MSAYATAARQEIILFMTESPEQLHSSFQDAFNRRDLDSIVALYEPDAVLARLDGPVRGTDAIREAYRPSLATRPTTATRQNRLPIWRLNAPV
jgi:ketosteroid isomerase-like protein